MFGPPGYAYVYLIYGFHFCVNAVCQKNGVAEAVLIRAIEPAIGRDSMETKRPVQNPGQLTNGPGKLCQALGIDRNLNAVDLCDVNAPVFIARGPDLVSFLSERGPLLATPRIGITKAASLPLRFLLRASPFLSRKPVRLPPV